MFKYKYEGTGIMTFTVDEKSYTVGYNHAILSDTIELPEKVNIAGLVLIEEEQKRETKKKTKKELM